MKKAAILALAILCVLAPRASAGQVTIYVNIGVAEVEIKDLVVTPGTVHAGGDVDFAVNLKNVGDVIVSIGSGSKVEILSGENDVVATLDLYPPKENLAPGQHLILTASWNTGSTPPGSYTAKATIHYDNLTVQGTASFTITSPPAPPPLPELPEGEVLRLNRLPVMSELRPGETVFTCLSVLNRSSSTIWGLQVSVAGSAGGWVSIVPSTFSLGAGEEATLNVTINVPSNASTGDYGLQITIAKGTARAESTSLIRVKPYPPGYARASVTRLVALDREKNRTSVTLSMQNGNTFAEVVELVEEIPKVIADNVGMISFATVPTEILEPDPVVKWALENLEPYETRTISYSTARVLSDYTSYAYWPVKQLTVIYRRPAELLKVTDLVAPMLIAGENGVLRAKLINMNTTRMTVTVRLSLPAGWVSVPSELAAELDPRDAAEFTFNIRCPGEATPGLYLGELRATYAGGELVREVTFSVARPPFQLWDYMPYLAVLGCVIVVGGFLVKRSRQPYRKRVVELLKRIKEEDRR